MGGFVSFAIIVICILLILVVLVQNSKGGGLASGFSANTQIMGVRRTADFLEKTTWGLALGLFLFALLASPRSGSESNASSESVSKKRAAEFVPASKPAPKAASPATNATAPTGTTNPSGK